MVQHLAQFQYDDRFMHMQPRVAEHSAFGIVMSIAWLVIVVGVLIAIYKMATNYSRDHGAVHRDPIDIAKERFAKGEISKEQLAEIKKELKN